MIEEDMEIATVQGLHVLAEMGFKIVTKDGNDLTDKLKKVMIDD